MARTFMLALASTASVDDISCESYIARIDAVLPHCVILSPTVLYLAVPWLAWLLGQQEKVNHGL